MLAAFIILLLIVLGLPRLITEVYSINRILQPQDSPVRPVGIVFGAGLYRDGSPTPVLQHRVETAVGLYQSGKISKILMSGDNRFADYNEPAAMQSYAIQLGVPEEDIVLDYAGRRTYDTCYRAKYIFDVDQPILITQRFHLPRALFTCRLIGLNGVGVKANQVVYRKTSRIFWNTREIGATLVAMWELLITRPLPVMGDPEPIFKKSMEG